MAVNRIDDDFEIIGQEEDDFEVIGYDSPDLQKLEAMDDFDAVAKEPQPQTPDPKPDKKLPFAPPAVTNYLGFLGHQARNWLSSSDKKKATETIKRRVKEGESLEQIVPELEERGWTPEEQFEILDEFIPKPEKVEPVEKISVMDAFKSFDKRDLLKLTPKQVAGMSPAEFEYFVKRSGQLSQEEGALAVYNGMLFGLPDAFRKKMGLDAPGAIDPMMKGVGEMLGTLPLYAWANTAMINPLMNYVQGGKLMKGVLSVLGNTGVMATEQTLKRLIKEGNIPKLEEYTGYLADIAALEGVLKAAGKLNPFKSKVKQYAEAKGIPEDQVVTDLLKERGDSPLQPTNIVEDLDAKISALAQKTTAAKILPEEAASVKGRQPERVEPAATKESLELAKAEVKDTIGEMPEGNKKKVIQEAFDRGYIRNEEQLENILKEYNDIYPGIEGKVNERNRKFLNKYADKNIREREISTDAEKTEVDLYPPEQKLLEARTGKRVAKAESDKPLQKESQKKIDLAKRKIEQVRQKQEAQKRKEAKEKPKEETKTEEAPKAEGKPAVQEFTTAKGSTYQLHADGTTTRTKAKRLEHGEDQGLKDTSEKTYFLTEEDANKLSLVQTQGGGKRIVEDPDGRIGVMFTDGPNKGKISANSIVTPQKAPAEGLMPLETWQKGTRTHFGNKITKVGKVVAQPKKLEAKKSKPAGKKKKPVAEPKKPQKEKKPKPPVHVDIPPEDLGKSAKEILSPHVQTGKPAWQFKLPNVKSVARVMEQKLYNQYAPLKDLKHGDSALENPRIMAEQVKGFLAKAESVLKYADYDAATGLANGPAFQDIFLPKRVKQLTGKAKLDRHDLDVYLASKASLERQALGQKNPMPTKAAESFIRQNDAKYQEIADDIHKFGKNRINNLVKEGITSPEGADKMFEMYKAHVPLYRMIPQERTLAEAIREGLTGKAPHQPGVLTPGAGNIKVKNPLFKAEGSDLVIASPTESLVKNTIAFEQAIAKNRAMKSIGRGLEQQGYEVKQIKGPKQTAEQMAENLGLSVEEVEGMLEELNEAANFLNPPKVEGKLRWFENGNMYEVSAPKDIVKVVEGLGPKEAGIVMNALKSWKNMFSQGVVFQPGTLMRLSGMDMVVGALQTKFPKKGLLEIPDRLLYEYPRMFYNIMKKSDLYQSYVRSGAAQTSLQGLDREALASMTDTLTNAQKTKSEWLKETLNFPKQVFSALKKTSDVLGDVPRLLEYERSMEAAMKAGFSRKEAMAQAAFDAFETTVPYGRKGGSRSLQNVYDMVPFVNTVVNSGVSMAKALDPRNPNFRYVVASATAYLTLPTVRQYLKNRNDPRYQAIPQEDRDRNVYVYQTDDPHEEPLKFRKFWQYGYVFQTLPEHLIEFAIQQDPKALEGLGSAFEYEFSPFTLLSFSSAMEDGGFDPEKFLSGARYSVIPDRQKQIEKEFQSTENTTETAKMLAKYSKISPLYIDYMVNMTGGGLGKDVMRLADEFIYQTGMKEDRRPDKQAADSIFFGTFYARGTSKRNEYSNKFYAYCDKYEKAKATAKMLREEERDEEADKIMEGYVDTTKMRAKMGEFYKRIAAIRREHPKDLDGTAKRKELNTIYQEMTDMAKLFVENIEDQQKQ